MPQLLTSTWIMGIVLLLLTMFRTITVPSPPNGVTERTRGGMELRTCTRVLITSAGVTTAAAMPPAMAPATSVGANPTSLLLLLLAADPLPYLALFDFDGVGSYQHLALLPLPSRGATWSTRGEEFTQLLVDSKLDGLFRRRVF